MFDKIKEMFNKETQEGTEHKKKYENLAVFLIILIITLMIINSILSEDEESNEENDTEYKELADFIEEDEMATSDDLETKLENILETMEGVRKCKCFSDLFAIQ